MPTQTTPVAVLQLVAMLRDHADRVRARAALVASGARVMQWQSLSSGHFHRRLEVLLARLTSCAAEFDRAADAVLVLAASR